jgi:hypothetical protein
MSGQLSTNYFESAEITSNTQTRLSQTLSNKVIRRAIGGQFWSMKLKSSALTRDQASELSSFLNRQNGQFEDFTVIPPVISNTRSTNASGTPTVTATYNPGVSSITANGGSGSLKAGDFIKFSNHDKVYQLTADVDQDASSVDTFGIYPVLTQQIDSSTTIIYNNVSFKVFLVNDQNTFATGTDGTFRLDVNVREEI